MTDPQTARLDQLREGANYYRQRLDLYRARLYGGRAAKRNGRAPFVAGMAISLADPGGPIEAIKEISATLKTVLRAGEEGGRGELVDEIAREVAEDARHARARSRGGNRAGARTPASRFSTSSARSTESSWIRRRRKMPLPGATG
jgi:hypothetical protein